MDADLHLQAIAAERNVDAARLALARRARSGTAVGAPRRGALSRGIASAMRAATSALRALPIDARPPEPNR